MTTQEIDTAQTEAFVERLFGATLGAIDVMSVYLGDRLGLYHSLAKDGPATPPELAKRAGIHPRYAREWLEQQAVSEVIEVDDASKSEDERKYTLPAAHAEALIDPESPFSIAPLARAFASIGVVLPKLLEAYRTGGGVAWADYGADGIEAQGDFNRPWLVHQFGTEFLPAVPDVHARLQADPPARVADVACGVGWAGISIAKAYPKVRVDGFDFDTPSIALAQGFARDSAVADRVSFRVRDAADPAAEGAYDLAVVIEAIHDMSRPVEALTAIRKMLAPGGTAIIADERVEDQFTTPGNEVERLLYGASVLICLPASMAEQPSAATGTVIRPSTMRRYASEAGFSNLEVLEQIEHPFLRFYRLTP
jgi:2-polyprenyl-3-methyl-5-hydroxy-6-metoxy-1,4-benzoquinol methylase